MSENVLPWVTRQDLQQLLDRISRLETKVYTLQIQVAEIQDQKKELTPNEIRAQNFVVYHSDHAEN